MIGTVGSVAGADAVAGGAAGHGAGGVVSRPRLVGRLAARARVSVVSAPPGSGKTVLLRSWIGQPGVAGSAAWVPAGRGERDPQRFWLSVLAALRQLELLIMRAPPQLRFVLATRHDVRLGLHRLRLEGELAEIREPDLRFTVAEASELFAAAGVELDDPSLAKLHELSLIHI